MKLAVVFVHYHTDALLAEAVAAARCELARPPLAGLDSEVLVVDNGSSSPERETLARLPVRLLRPDRNVGYAGGINLGFGATRAEILFAANPDVRVGPGCLSSLVETLEREADVVGPRCFWDDQHRFVMPPADAVGRGEELLRALAERGGWLRRLARRRWRRHAHRHWEAELAIPSFALSGALLGIRRDAWERVGPFDGGYRLYFEETDWLWRARRHGLQGRYVPAAQAIHRYAQSTAAEPRSAQWFAESASRFRRRHYGIGSSRLLEALATRRGASASREPLRSDPVDLAPFARQRPAWIEVSPTPSGFPAVGERLPRGALGRWSFPFALVKGQELESLRVCLVDELGEEIGSWRIEVPR